MDFSTEESEKLQSALLQKPYFMRKIQNVDNLIQKHIRNKHKSTKQRSSSDETIAKNVRRKNTSSKRWLICCQNRKGGFGAKAPSGRPLKPKITIIQVRDSFVRGRLKNEPSEVFEGLLALHVLRASSGLGVGDHNWSYPTAGGWNTQGLSEKGGVYKARSSTTKGQFDWV